MKAILRRATTAVGALTAILTFVLALAAPSTASTTYPPPGGGTTAATVSRSAGTGGVLANTGVPVLEIALIGAALLAGGALLVVAARRRGGKHA